MQHVHHASCPNCSTPIRVTLSVTVAISTEPKGDGWRGGQSERKCSNCGQPGHRRETCGRINGPMPENDPFIKKDHTLVEALPQKPEPKDTRSVRAKVKELWEGGLDAEEVVDALPEVDPVEVRAVYRDLERKRGD